MDNKKTHRKLKTCPLYTANIKTAKQNVMNRNEENTAKNKKN
jgi:hypothetical protein